MSMVKIIKTVQVGHGERAKIYKTASGATKSFAQEITRKLRYQRFGKIYDREFDTHEDFQTFYREVEKFNQQTFEKAKRRSLPIFEAMFK